MLERSELAEIVTNSFGFDMPFLKDLLFVSFSDVYLSLMLDVTDPMNPVVRIVGHYSAVELTCSKDLLTINTSWDKTETHNLHGLVLYTPMTNRFYVTHQAVASIAAFGIK